MTTPLTTFEDDFRRRLLDVVYGQWHDLGVPFAPAPPRGSTEIIDPDALLWCSLEFLPTEPRLREGVAAWWHVHGKVIIRQRLNRLAKPGEPRTAIWHRLTPPSAQARGSEPDRPTEPCHGLQSPEQVIAFCAKFEHDLGPDRRKTGTGESPRRLGSPLVGPSTLAIQARNLLGTDLRHILLIHLLTNPHGVQLRTLQRQSGYSYRSLLDIATRWEDAGAVALDRGFCRLTRTDAWHSLLRDQAREAVLVDWLQVFEACVSLLRALTKGGRKGLAWDAAVLTHFREETDRVLSAALAQGRGPFPSVAHLREPFQQAGHENKAGASRQSQPG
ncbi:MAG: hypothetical protein NTW19_01740 [Planctomycetota bacterium]|nr:hypothetical protein [Planctomycetota bacterium]